MRFGRAINTAPLQWFFKADLMEQDLSLPRGRAVGFERPGAFAAPSRPGADRQSAGLAVRLLGADPGLERVLGETLVRFPEDLGAPEPAQPGPGAASGRRAGLRARLVALRAWQLIATLAVSGLLAACVGFGAEACGSPGQTQPPNQPPQGSKARLIGLLIDRLAPPAGPTRSVASCPAAHTHTPHCAVPRWLHSG